jgi:DNA-directed RNA polymerase subunit F
MYEARNYVIFSVSELNKIIFNEVLETSTETVRRSIDGTKTFVKWDGENIPESIQSLSSIEGIYSHDDMLGILQTPEWTTTS